MTTRSTLTSFQDAFAHALLARDAKPAAEVSALAAQPAFAVYRNTVMKGCIDALCANYPTVARLVGDEWFRAAATIYVREGLPTDATLLRYGAGFADFLARFEPVAELPYLAGVARLDRFWNEAHAAPDVEALEPAEVASLELERLTGAMLQPHPAARWAWFGEGPIYTIWSANRIGKSVDADLDWRPEGALIVRPRYAVEWIALDASGCAFLDACAAGDTIADAAQAAIGAKSDADLTQLMSALLKAGAFSRVTFSHSQPLTKGRS